MMLNDKIFDAAILCGGASSRMGRDKALLELGGRKFISILADELSDFGRLFLSCGEKDGYEGICAEPVQDIYPGCGPASGIHSILNASCADGVFFVPCDVPFFSREGAVMLCSKLSGEYDAVVVREGERLHPLTAVYSKSCLPVLESCIVSGTYRIGTILEQLRVCYVSSEELPGGSMDIMNINTIEDYGDAVRRADSDVLQP